VINNRELHVPSINIYNSKQILKARLQAAIAFETSFQQIHGQGKQADYQVRQALNLLAKSDDAVQNYTLLAQMKQRDYENAIVIKEKAEELFRAGQAQLVDRQKAFEAGVQRYKDAQERQAFLDCLTGIFKVIGAIGATVATCGAAAPVAVATAVSTTAQVADKAKTLIEQLKNIYKTLKALYEKIQPVFKALGELAKIAKTAVDNMQELNRKTTTPTSLKPDTQSNDPINPNTEWEAFRIEIISMKDSLRTTPIDDKDGFFIALEKLVVLGQAQIYAQTHLVFRSDDLTAATMQKRIGDQELSRNATMTYDPSQSEKVLKLLQKVTFDRLLAVRSLVYVDFGTYCSAYEYHTLRESE